MRAGIVYIKVPISAIEYQDTKDDVTLLKKSIQSCGLLQPVGIVRKNKGYKLVFGRRRIKACKELNMKYIHGVLLSLKTEEENFFALNENINRKNTGIKEIAESILQFESENSEITHFFEKSARIKEYLTLSKKAKEFVTQDTERFLDFSKGDSEFYIKMCKFYESIPEQCREKVRLSVLSDKRIFINEIEKIIMLMKKGGFNDFVYENEEQIVILRNRQEFGSLMAKQNKTV